jgi:hypothetical protein
MPAVATFGWISVSTAKFAEAVEASNVEEDRTKIEEKKQLTEP